MPQNARSHSLCGTWPTAARAQIKCASPSALKPSSCCCAAASQEASQGSSGGLPHCAKPHSTPHSCAGWHLGERGVCGEVMQVLFRVHTLCFLWCVMPIRSGQQSQPVLDPSPTVALEATVDVGPHQTITPCPLSRHPLPPTQLAAANSTHHPQPLPSPPPPPPNPHP